jgi:ABC-type dipeptide/oligopeptide/nickel transport system permease component
MVVISVLAFWALARTGQQPEPGSASLPLFFNRAPRDVRDRALEAMRRVAAGADRQDAAAAELARLGGAALPHLLPRLDTLAPEARGRVAVALKPVAERMHVGSPEQLSDPERAVAFWTDFWQTRAVDFRPAVVKRLVKRLGQRTSLSRREDIAELDTFALEELMEALTPLRDAADLRRVQRIANLASDLTGLPWRIRDHAGIEQARAVSFTWLRWWNVNRSSYVTFDGPRRLSAMLTETAYGHWATHAVQSRFGTTASGRPVLDEFRDRAPVTLALLLAGLIAGPIGGVLAGIIAAARAKRAVDIVGTALALLAVAIPAVTLASWLPARGPGAGATALAALAMAALSSGLVCLYHRNATCSALQGGPALALTALGASAFAVARRQLKFGLVSVLGLLGAQTPVLLTSAFVLERGLDLPGLGPATLAAVRAGDDAWLMALVLASMTTTALVQIGSDVLLALVDPRLAAAPGRRGAHE